MSMRSSTTAFCMIMMLSMTAMAFVKMLRFLKTVRVAGSKPEHHDWE